jgi:hypothetical protein
MLPPVGAAISRRKKYTAATTIACNSGNHTNSRSRRAGASRQPTPMPRKLASRMKLEKYASNRM